MENTQELNLENIEWICPSDRYMFAPFNELNDYCKEAKGNQLPVNYLVCLIFKMESAPNSNRFEVHISVSQGVWYRLFSATTKGIEEAKKCIDDIKEAEYNEKQTVKTLADWFIYNIAGFYQAKISDVLNDNIYKKLKTFLLSGERPNEVVSFRHELIQNEEMDDLKHLHFLPVGIRVKIAQDFDFIKSLKIV